ncbi:MAG: M24 family metallopeptidase, partial [Gemmatimonadota bacterium]
MTTRRTFLASVTTAGAGLAIGAPHAAADPGVGAGQPTADLPPAIRALRPMTAGVVPISVAERQGRIERATRLMRERGIDALMLTGGTSMVYFTGIEWGISERLLAAFLPVRGRPFLVTPKFEEERAMEQVALGPMQGGADVYAWEEHEDPYALVAQALQSRGLATATIACEETVRFQFSHGISRLAAVTVVDGTPVTAGCRMVKDAHEIALMRHASAVTLTAYEAAWKSLREGMTQDAFARLVSAAHVRLGYTGGAG